MSIVGANAEPITALHNGREGKTKKDARFTTKKINL